MKEKNWINIVMHYIVHNSFLITVAFMLMVHAVLLGVLAFAKILPLMYFNVLSVIVYLFCVVLCRFGHMVPVYISIMLEVSVYSVMAVRMIGWHSASFCFLLAIVPVIIYFGCMMIKGSKRWIIALLLLANFSIFVLMYLIYHDTKPMYELAGLTRHFLVIFSSFVMVFSVVFYNVVYIYSSEYEMYNLEQENEQLTVDAKEDSLTGLLNRRGFLPLVDKAMKSDAVFCIAFSDIDNFKRINDSYGHDCGDEVLRHISRTIVRELPGCSVCRWGGEEIVVLMNGYDSQTAKVKLESIRKNIEDNATPFFNKRIPATITIGLAESDAKYEKPEDIIKVSDERMYYGKQHGKNILVFEIAG